MICIPRRLVVSLSVGLLFGTESYAEPPETTTSEAAPSEDASAERSISGTWVLDLEASGDLKPLLEAQGVPRYKRGVIAGMTVTQVIVDHADRVSLRSINPHGTKEVEMMLDGVTREESSDKGVARISSTRKGEAVVTTTETTEDGKKVLFVVRRVVSEDGQTLLQDMELRREGTDPVKVRRVFRLQVAAG